MTGARELNIDIIRTLTTVSAFAINAQHRMIMVTHDCISGAVNDKDGCQFEHTLFKPVGIVFETITAVAVFPT